MSRWKNIQAVLFDLDGTLLDSAQTWPQQQMRCAFNDSCPHFPWLTTGPL